MASLQPYLSSTLWTFSDMVDCTHFFSPAASSAYVMFCESTKLCGSSESWVNGVGSVLLLLSEFQSKASAVGESKPGSLVSGAGAELWSSGPGEGEPSGFAEPVGNGRALVWNATGEEWPFGPVA